ncbi:Hypothetical protein CulFRC58_2136 [Corynebacterium ulcerans FRC58]|uniref:Uncharacterized protein n=1 Tax=Corynebacterium ulcerans FRC58 TaxID=1408268 RepID=A0ABM5U3C1_CORUL|nr:Hypothetical protein CulFRC58_2136 [Corynebacterium ulcerans FRC58]
MTIAFTIDHSNLGATSFGALSFVLRKLVDARLGLGKS